MTPATTRLAALVLLACLPACNLHIGGWSGCDESEEREHVADLAGVREVHVIASAGSLDVRGDFDAAQLVARGTARASSLEALEEIALEVVQVGDVLRVETRMAPEDTEGWSGCRAFDLEVTLPRDLPVVIRDGSGDTRVSDVGALEVDDGSGDLTIRRVVGDVSVEDGSGDLTIEDVGGDLRVNDGSGDVRLLRVNGFVELQDGSGDVSGSSLRGGVHVLRDGSGSLRFTQMIGSVVVDSDGSGDVTVDDVRGDFVLHADGSGSVRFDAVSGTVRLPR